MTPELAGADGPASTVSSGFRTALLRLRLIRYCELPSTRLAWVRSALAPPSPRELAAEVGELQRDAEVGLAELRDRGLEVVLLLAAHAELLTLDLVGDALEAESLDELADLAGLHVGDPDVQVRGLTHGSLGGVLDLAVRECLQRNLAAHELLLEHLRERAEAVLARGVQLDRRVAEVDGAVGVLEVVARRDLAAGLVHGVADLLVVDLGNDVERRHVTPGNGFARLVSYAPRVGTRVAKGGSL